MSDGALSQDEIDALMSGSSTGGFDFGGGTDAGGNDLTENEKQAFLSIINTIIDAQSATLTGMMGKSVNISPPSVEIIEGESIPVLFGESFIRVKSSFTEGIKGYHSYLFTADISKAIAGLLTGLDQVDLDDAALSAVSEAVNTVSGSAVTVFGDKLNKTIMTEPAAADILDSSSSDLPSGNVLKLNYPITIEGYPQAVFNEIFDISAVKMLVSKNISQPAAASAGMDDMFAGMGGNAGPGGGGGSGQYGQSSSPGSGMGGMMQQGGMGSNMGGQKQGFVNIQNVQYPSLTPGHSGGDQGNISLLMDVNMEMTVELGRTKKPIREILSMGEGTIIELDKLAGEPVDILVNHKLIANGEVVVIDENFGVRVTKIVSNSAGINDMT